MTPRPGDFRSPGVRARMSRPRPACPQMYRCGARECGWQPACAPPPDHYPDQRGWQGPQVYSAPGAPPAYDQYGRQGQQVYSAPSAPPAYDQYGPQVYSAPQCSACLRPVRAAGSAGVLRPWRGTGSGPLNRAITARAPPQVDRNVPRRSSSVRGQNHI